MARQECDYYGSNWEKVYDQNGFTLYRNAKEKMAMAILVNVPSTTTSVGNITTALGTYGCSSAKQVMTGCTVLSDTAPYYLSVNGNQLSLYSAGLYSFPQKSGIYGSIVFPIT